MKAIVSITDMSDTDMIPFGKLLHPALCMSPSLCLNVTACGQLVGIANKVLRTLFTNISTEDLTLSNKKKLQV